MDKITLCRDVQSLFTGNPNDECLKRIGQGNNRVVYRVETDKYGSDISGCVVKVSDSVVENRREYNIWSRLQDSNIGKDLVPVKSWGNGFQWILMPYYEPVNSSSVNEDLYRRLSEKATDISKDDFVKDLNTGRQMCCDYATLSTEEVNR